MLRDYQAIADTGNLSPFSTTSLTWPTSKWPIKPEVLFEGGNVARGPNRTAFDTDDLKMLSTYYRPQVAQFAAFDATSAASAQGAWMAAKIQVAYPETWPDSIRALIVHAADWTPGPKSHIPGERIEKLVRPSGKDVGTASRFGASFVLCIKFTHADFAGSYPTLR